MPAVLDAENSIWSYLSESDGFHCPLNSRCNSANEGWCLETFRDRLKELIERGVRNPDGFTFPICPKCTRMYAPIERLAGWYLHGVGITHPPVPIEAIKHADPKVPLEVRLLPLKSNHGAVWRLPDAWVIHLNSNDSPERRRFTLFHEVFHILAQNHGVPFITQSCGDDSFVEIMADCFAAAVLIPKPWAISKWAETGHVLDMRDVFQVPTPTMLLRLNYLALI